jgi:hypothetical protein
MAAAQAITNYVPRHSYIDYDPFVQYPVMGAHLGPDLESDIGGFFQTYHHPRLICCKLRSSGRTDANSVKWNDPCLYAIHRKSASAITLETYKMFLFDDIATYIIFFVRPLFSEFSCISFSWAPRFSEADKAVKDMHKVPGISPGIVVMNMGIHDALDKNANLVLAKDQFRSLMKSIDYLSVTFKTKFMMHSPTFLRNETAELLLQEARDLVNTYTSTWSTLTTTLQLYNLTRALHSIEECSKPDGVHFRVNCNYQAILLQWDLNWFQYLGIFG